jgi:hypothetical protein
MFKGAGFPNRVDHQKCGILFGSNSCCRNYPFRHVALRLSLEFDLPTEHCALQVYPSLAQDMLSKFVSDAHAHHLKEIMSACSANTEFDPRFLHRPSYVLDG